MSKNSEECSNLRVHISDIARLLDEGDIIEVGERINKDAVIVRASGNPLTKEDWLKMYTSSEFNMYMNRLISINNITVSEDCNMGYVCYTMHSRFVYKGKANDDISVYLAIFKKFESDWMITYMQKSQGRNPVEGIPVFN
tara:strand:- start:2857 stop:3276 length:420 start_codon:yes stop_codon:yes gene_type:complete